MNALWKHKSSVQYVQIKCLYCTYVPLGLYLHNLQQLGRNLSSASIGLDKLATPASTKITLLNTGRSCRGNLCCKILKALRRWMALSTCTLALAIAWFCGAASPRRICVEAGSSSAPRSPLAFAACALEHKDEFLNSAILSKSHARWFFKILLSAGRYALSNDELTKTMKCAYLLRQISTVNISVS